MELTPQASTANFTQESPALSAIVQMEQNEIAKFLIDHQGKSILISVGGNYFVTNIIYVDVFGGKLQHQALGMKSSWMDIANIFSVK